ncbi:DNA phosphorothioation system restriction enzyme [Gloeocapsopsis dulcis]|uniref:DNA phosphorothioation system restriction enzyme n=1 Tax=Gloeocapsopsis dulcis AAB1 = 1H9 TaxID=1433147 RepID=A0A6N8FWB5_9CHRO|nr:DNA phosphorothioation system restriction enzyme [Gloeocapsopsis dulcis]MUL36902.1 DNA phosphorothioation system restriction enzyme [Gloeocapsopsis dulcis AAB1 = 1H9]WNN88716.1 DNA phosphorothioation system restriction enzyme [Gloeocapsopsis dulcis]
MYLQQYPVKQTQSKRYSHSQRDRTKLRLVVAENKGDYQVNLSIVNKIPPGCPRIPPFVQLRQYQRQAVVSWFANHGRGTLKMATGSGKTITALCIATELYQKIGLQVLLVVCPYQHLVTQWAKECEKFNLQPILAFENLRNWHSALSTQLYNVHSGNQRFLTVITTNSTLIGDGFQSQLKYFPEKTLIVGDEAHNLGAPRLEECLPRRVGLRLALSATPERYFDEEGTQFLFDYFGNVLQPAFTLRDAIAQGALVHYLYYPILVELTEAESLAYAKLTKRIGRALLFQQRDIITLEKLENNEDLTPLLMQRARLIGAAENKLNALRDLMVSRRETTHTLFYCSDSAQNSVQRSSIDQLNAVARILGLELGFRVSTYTAQTPLQERENLRRQFETGELQGLVAIRCLDEGVDIPAIETAVILASSGNPRQFIQRRGRVLRPHPGKERATIFDMIVLPPELDREALEVERNLLRKELRRFVEFADLADNNGEARMKLFNLQKKYDLLDI